MKSPPRNGILPIAEQRRIAAILDKADAIRAKRRQTLALADALFASLSQRAFRGAV